MDKHILFSWLFIQFSESVFRVTASLAGLCAGSPDDFRCPVAPAGGCPGCFRCPHHKQSLYPVPVGYSLQSLIARSQGMHNIRFPRLCCGAHWDRQVIRRSCSITCVDWGGGGALEPSCPSECEREPQN